jgi:hypothetical protein
MGAGPGIHSYPSALDPYGFAGSLPAIYPLCEMNFLITDKVAVGGILSRTTIDGSLRGHMLTDQYLKMYTFGLGIEFDLTRSSGFFGVGLQLMSVIGSYNVAGSGKGLGMKIYGVARQRALAFLSWGVRTGVQRIWLEPTVWNERLLLDSVTIELMFYISIK